MLAAGVVVLLAAALAAFTYLGLERLGRQAWVPLVSRAVAWSAIGLLLLNVSCPASGSPLRPLVLLDGSISMGAPGGRWAEALDSARRAGTVRVFGDEVAAGDTSPTRGRSLLRPALTAAAASERPVLVVTDGEIEDAADIPAELIGRAAVSVLPRRQQPDLALVSLTGPSRVTAGDSVVLELEVRSLAGARAESLRVEVVSGNRTLAGRALRLDASGAARSQVGFSSSPLGSGEHVLRVRLTGGRDEEPRTDARLHVVSVARTPGVVLLAAPADWDSRFLYRSLREVAQLPVRGYVQIDGERWRSMEDLAPVSTARVRESARGADLLILKGNPGSIAQGSSARGVWRWPSGITGAAPIPGDWYLSPNEVSPVAGAFLGVPVDSFPPATQLVPVEPGPSDWTALTAQLGRRGASRPAVIGRQEGRLRSVTVAVDGLWRWAFRGGPSEQSYRTWIAATASWLLGGADSVRGVAAPVRAVVQNGRPLIFEWTGAGPPTPTQVVWADTGGTHTDTLRFDGAGRAEVRLPPGQYRYRLERGGGGTVAVEEYSDELLPAPVTLDGRAARVPLPESVTAARDWLWLFGIAVAALSLEWLARRRLGLR
ncbi:MAG TPA: hypothetical protein VHG35_04165 [Gemmatimonadales bacterium]|nr:hypothetical protein [Gemmatimonadales bacterium]